MAACAVHIPSHNPFGDPFFLDPPAQEILYPSGISNIFKLDHRI